MLRARVARLGVRITIRGRGFDSQSSRWAYKAYTEMGGCLRSGINHFDIIITTDTNVNSAFCSCGVATSSTGMVILCDPI